MFLFMLIPYTNVDALHPGAEINFEYRFHPTINAHFIRKGWHDYDFGPGSGIDDTRLNTRLNINIGCHF